MRSSVAGLTVILISVLAGCTVFRGSWGQGTEVDLSLNWDFTSQSCKAEVQEKVYVSKKRPHITWTVTDHCNQTENQERETQFAFQYSETPWLDAGTPIARTKKNGKDKIKYSAQDRGQPLLAEAKYSIFYNGRQIADPRVVWGK
jgi:hypothetical protein